MSPRSGGRETDDGSASDWLLTVAILAISLIRGVARRPTEPAAAAPAGRPSPRGEGRSGASGDVTRAAPELADLARVRDRGRGRNASTPAEIPTRGLRDVAKRVAADTRDDNLTLLAAGVAFYSVLALFPAMVAVVSIYGLVADPAEVSRQIGDLTSALPEEAADIIVERMEDLVSSESGSLGFSAAVGIAVALWSASSGMQWLMRALTLIYDEQETRKFVPLRGRALLLTFGAIVGLVVSVMLIAGASSIARWAGLGQIGQTVVSVVRWPAMGLVMLFGLALLYRYGPNRATAQLRWASWGSAVGMVVWLLASAGFAVYVSVAGSNESYGSLAGVIVLMLWLWLTCVAILLGAEVNAELERQTARDTTTGEERPLGGRGAMVADSLGPRAEEVDARREAIEADKDEEAVRP